jgi:hydroxymethylpyrimidine pyrophosphatase-like HAD family hydrolase
MHYLVLATDYDGTLAHHGHVDEPTMEAVRRLRESGRALVLVTGRQLEDLLAIFPEITVFDRIVAENGAVLYNPHSRETRALAAPPSPALLAHLQERGVPHSVGHVIVATHEPHEVAVLEAIRTLGLELQVIFNKGAVMVLPSGVNKATGLDAALCELGMSRHNCVGVGDAENDHAFLSRCECAVAVANALPMLKKEADWVTQGLAGAGVVELIDGLVAADLAPLRSRLVRHAILLGSDDEGRAVSFLPHGSSLLVAGTSGSGKSTLTTGILERLIDAGYQFCLVDPEGDYPELSGAIVLGDAKHVPTIAEVMGVLDAPDRNLVVNLVGMGLQDRPAFFDALFLRLQELRARTARPHWIILDEAHHLLPAARNGSSATIPPSGLILITVHPEHVSPAVLATAEIAVVVGDTAADVVERLAENAHAPRPAIESRAIETGQALVWRRGDEHVVRIRSAPSRHERRRHVRKYAEGELGEDRSFYFRGPEGKLNLRASNLTVFLNLADGVDDDTWQHHLRKHDYSRWLREAIKDADLAQKAEQVEARPDLPVAESRALLKEAIAERYTLPA